MNIRLVKGGWDGGDTLEERVAISQRPADGHVKSGIWEDATILTKGKLSCDEDAGKLEKDDFIALHTTPTLGYITALGIAVEGAVEGLELQLATVFDVVDFEVMTWHKAKYVEADFEFDDAEFAPDSSIGAERVWISGVVENINDGFLNNTDVIGLKVIKAPDAGVPLDTLRIVTRMQYTQPVRPPAYMNCCGDNKLPVNSQ